MQQERHIAGVRVFVEVVDPRGVERGRPALDAMHRVTEAEQIFGEIGAVLPSDAGNQGNAPFRILNSRSFSSNAPTLTQAIRLLLVVGRKSLAAHNRLSKAHGRILYTLTPSVRP